MDKMICMLAALALVGVMAEPPVSSVSSQYLPAEHRNTQSQLANQYGTPAEFDTPRSSIQYAVPSAEYGVPSQSQNSFELSAEFSIPSIPSGRLGGANIPSNQYSVPHAPTRAPALSNQKGTKQGSVNFSGIRSPSGQHAAVAISDRNGGKAPSNHYGAPGASSRFENLSRQQSITAGSSSLPAQFGAHGALSRSGGANSLSTQYGAPATSQHFGGASSLSTQYGAPATSRHFGGASSLSTQYGAPRLSGRLGVAGSLSTLYDVGSHSGTANSLRTHYGVPRASSPVSGPSTLSSQYGAPASPSRFGGASSLATQYGAPSHSSPFNTPTSSQYASGGGYTASREGYKAQEDDLAEPANYQFSYEVQDSDSGSEFSQEESRQDESAQGSYRVLLPDGRLQIVEYEADQEGYRPQIRYEDTGAGYPRGPQQRGQGQNQGPY